MKRKDYVDISSISGKEMQSMMQKYAKSKCKSVRTSRKYLRGLGLNIKPDGTILPPTSISPSSSSSSSFLS